MSSRVNRRRLQRVTRRERNTAIALAVAGISVIGSAAYLGTLGTDPLAVGSRSTPKVASPRVSTTTPSVPTVAPQQQTSTIAATDVLPTTGATPAASPTSAVGARAASSSADEGVLVCACLASLPEATQPGSLPTAPLPTAPVPGAGGPASPGTGAGGTGGTRPIATTTTTRATVSSTTTTTTTTGPLNLPGVTLPEPVRGVVGTLPLP